jgi:multidrug efflux pump subunit AcrA (membrane-fusion protein)
MNMKLNHQLAAGAALGAIILAAPSPAAAKPRKHSNAGKHVADSRDAEIRELKAQVKALTARLDADEASQQQAAQAAQAAQAQAASAQAAAATAQSQAATALNQSQTVQTQVASVQKEVPPLEKAVKTGWFANTTIGGRAFFNVSNIHQTSTDLAGNRTENIQNGTQTELKRFYLIVDHKFDNVFSANLTTDFRYNANGTSKDVLVFVKKAWVQAKFSPALSVRIGENDTPWVPFVESLYGYRFVENTLIDRTKFGTSTDWGVHLFGTFGDNLVTYQVSALNGAGFKTLSRSSNTIDLEGRIGINPIKEVTLGVGGYTGKLGKSNDTVNVNHRATRFDAVAAYTSKRVRAGLEYFAATNWNNITTAPVPLPAPSTPNDKAHGWSAFGSFVFTPKFNIFGRYDWVKPTNFVAPGTGSAVHDHYFNAGVDYKPIPPLDFALVYKHERANNGFISTSNGIIGGLDTGKYDEVGLFGQLTF